MFWKKDPPAQGGSARTKRDSGDEALDSLGLVLRVLGEHAFDTDRLEARDVRELFEDWSSRVLIGGRGEEKGRDWGGLRRFVTEHRREESEYVRRAVGDLREAVQSFARCVTRGMTADQDDDSGLRVQCARLSQAAETNDIELLREQAARMVDLTSRALERREARHEQHVQILSEQLRKLQSELSTARESAARDPLTKLYNRAALDAQLERLVDLGQLLGKPPCVMMVDIDHFKALNDTHGHVMGDNALREVANCLQRSFLRKEDFVARYGGEEFSILVLDCDEAGAERLTQRVLEAIRQISIPAGASPIRPTVSVGLAWLQRGDTPATWIDRADAALYRAKHSGRNRAEISPREVVAPLGEERRGSLRPQGTSQGSARRVSQRPEGSP
ncbi:MAG: GGDEF domain-containing protein, partial [Myxococcales bacterium]|nr:GGDEF domain-containing protein [Myxococcales bacterium]